jgi:stage II sporulation protein D
MRYNKFFIIAGLIAILLCGCDFVKDTSIENTEPGKIKLDYTKSEDVEIVDDDNKVVVKSDKIITRATAAKMIALANFNKKTIETMEREIEFEDTTPDNWFDKYINVMMINKWMLGSKKYFYPLNPLTYKELSIISDRFNIQLEDIELVVNNENENDAVSYEEFMSFYKILYNRSNYDGGINTRKLIVFATPSTSSELNAWKMATNHGMYSFEGLTLDCYLDNEIEVMIRDSEIIAVTGVISNSPKLTNAYIEKIKGTVATVFMGGSSRDLTINHDEYKDIENVIGDIIIDKGHITAILLKENKISEKVLLVGYEKVSLNNIGTYEFTKDAKIYSTNGTIKWKSITNIIVGYNSTDFVLDEEGKICAAIIRDNVSIENIRVLISTTNFTNKYHESISLSSNTDCIIEYGETKKKINAGDIVDINKKYFEDVDRIFIKAIDHGKITINSIKRGYGSNMVNPSYRGSLEISIEDEGYLIVNELPIEEYLYAVVPSEMPTSYGLEALKTQAVCARSYAYTQFYSNRFCKYGAHVIDSTQSQVYNNVKENENSIKAVNSTSKQGLTYNDRVVSANFYSTSCGYGANSGDVWASYKNKEFPTSSPEYLTAKPQFNNNNKYNDLSQEDIFREFIMDDNIDSYDKEFSYYRWSVELSREHIEASINSTIEDRYEVQPRLIKTLDENGIFRSRPVKSIGTLKDIGIYKRGKGGNITEMIIEGSEGVVKVLTEYNVRLLISPFSYIEGKGNSPVRLQNDKTNNNSKLMPSTFYVMDKEYDDNNNLIRIIFRGGGYGHGVGLSQNGVKGMVDKGYTFTDILKHYYSGTQVKEIY